MTDMSTRPDPATGRQPITGPEPEPNPHLIVRVDETRLALAESDLVDGPVQSIVHRLPLAPPTLAGLTNLGGAVVPVLDMRAALGLPDPANDDASRHTRFVRTTSGTIGLLVENAETQRVDVQPAALHQPPLTMLPEARRVVVGLQRDDTGLVAVLDVEAAVRRLRDPLD